MIERDFIFWVSGYIASVKQSYSDELFQFVGPIKEKLKEIEKEWNVFFYR